MKKYSFLLDDPDFSVVNNPTDELIDSLRERFPVEREVDRMLTRKMRNRSGAPYTRISIDEITEVLHRFLQSKIAGDYRVDNVRWFTGGVSKIQLGFTLSWNDYGVARTERLVVRMDPNEGSNATSRAREFELLQTANGHVPVPEIFWLDSEAEYFPQPALIYSFVSGVTKPRIATTGQISGIGTNFGPELRKQLAPQFLGQLAILHNLNVKDKDFEYLQIPEVGTTQSAEWVLNQARRTWEEDRAEDVPLLEVAINWLSRNLPKLDHVGVVHGDYRSGNFLYNEETNQIEAWLDWERGYIGDRHRDLAWMTQPAFGHIGEDGKYYVSGLIPLEDFFEAYEKASGLSVNEETLDFYRILNCFTIVVSALASTYRVAHLGKSHQDIVLTRVKGVVPVMLAEMESLLKRKI